MKKVLKNYCIVGYGNHAELKILPALMNFNRIKLNSKKIFSKLAKSGILVRKMDIYKIENSLRINSSP